MAPKPGNAFAMQKEAERLKQTDKQPEDHSGMETTERTDTHHSDANTISGTDENLQTMFQSSTNASSRPNIGTRRSTATSPNYDTIKTTTLTVPATQQDAPHTAGTTMTDLLGPETEREKQGRKMVQQQRESMEAKIKRKHSHKSRRSTDSSRTTVKHKSALPEPLFNKVRNMFKKSASPATTAAALDKPLPAISSPEAAYAQTYGVHIPYAYVPSPASVQGGPEYSQAFGQSYGQQGVVPFNPNAQAFHPDQYAQSHSKLSERGWPLPSARTATGHLSTQTFETNPSQYNHRTGNQGMIFASQFFTPTRSGDFATFGQPKVVHPPSMMSMAASLVDPQSPVAAQHEPNLSVVPEVQETKEEQAAYASEVEQLYNRGVSNSYSEDSPFRVRRGAASVDAPGVTATIPSLRRARSLPNIRFTTPAAAIPASPTNQEPANTAFVPASAQMVDELYFQVREDLKALHSALAGRAKASRRAIQSDLVILHDKIVGLERNDTFTFLEGRVAALDARTQRIEDKLDAIIDGMRAVGVGARVPGAGVGVRGGGVGQRLAAPGPHVPWGSQSLNARDREPSAGIGGGLEGAQAWYRAARRA